MLSSASDASVAYGGLLSGLEIRRGVPGVFQRGALRVVDLDVLGAAVRSQLEVGAVVEPKSTQHIYGLVCNGRFPRRYMTDQGRALAVAPL